MFGWRMFGLADFSWRRGPLEDFEEVINVPSAAAAAAALAWYSSRLEAAAKLFEGGCRRAVSWRH